MKLQQQEEKTDGNQEGSSRRIRPKRPMNYEYAEIGAKYCELMGYNPQRGIAKRKTLEDMGLKEAADRLGVK